MVDSKLTDDVGGSQTGLYELRGVITHQGITADSGHYTSFVKKTARKDPITGKQNEEDGKWWWFNDDKVSEVDADRIETLSGGGEHHQLMRPRRITKTNNSTRSRTFSPHPPLPIRPTTKRR